MSSEQVPPHDRLDGRPTDDVIAGRLLDLDFAIESDDVVLLDHLRDLYCDAAPCGPDPERIRLEREGPDHVLTLPDGSTERSVDGSWPLAMLHWHLNQRLVARSGRRLLLHAAAIERDGLVALLLGDSGAGKTTTALWLARRGWRYVADDIVALQADGSVVGAPRPVSIRPGTPEIIDVDPAVLAPPADRRGGSELYAAASALGATISPGGTIGAVVRLGVADGTPASRGALVTALCRSSFDLGTETAHRLVRLEQISRTTAFLDGPGRDLTTIERWLDRTVR